MDSLDASCRGEVSNINILCNIHLFHIITSCLETVTKVNVLYICINKPEYEVLIPLLNSYESMPYRLIKVIVVNYTIKKDMTQTLLNIYFSNFHNIYYL